MYDGEIPEDMRDDGYRDQLVDDDAMDASEAAFCQGYYEEPEDAEV